MMKTPLVFKLTCLFGLLCLLAPSIQAQCGSPCLDVGLSVDNNTQELTVSATASANMTAFPVNAFNVSVLTIKWPELSGGGNPVTISSVTDLYGFNLAADGAPQLNGGFYYQKFSGDAGNAQLSFVAATATDILEVAFTTSESTVVFELTNDGFTQGPFNGFPALIGLLGERFNGFAPSTATYNEPTFPVEWLYFDAQAIDSREAELSWATAAEGNNNFFQVEKSVDGDLFEPIARVQGVGNSTTTQEYEYLDKDYIAPKVFYRLKQVDYDGTFQHSDIVEVNFEAGIASRLEFELFPNPAHSVVTLKSLERVEGTFRVEIVDVTGRKVWKGIFEENIEGLTIPVDRLAEGIYTVYLVGPKLGTNHFAGRFVKK
ncbi:MAG: T9SS type A sorting domain-containing protein [Bacteroidota bacterium]